MRAIEGITKRDIRDVIAEAVRKTGTIAAAADLLGQDRKLVYLWIKDLDGAVTPRDTVEFRGYEPDTGIPGTRQEARELAEAAG